MLSRGGGGGTGLGSAVGVFALSGRTIVLKPLPAKSPTNAESAERRRRCGWGTHLMVGAKFAEQEVIEADG
jgi:hypothetical protein